MARKKTEVPEQSEIKNALRSVRIDVTAADIKSGTAMDPSGCAAAQAIMRVMKASEVRVHRGVTYIKIKNQWTRFKTSEGLRMETIVFDRGGMFIPGEYDLQPVPLREVLGPTKKKRSPSMPSNHKTGKRRVIPHVRIAARTRSTEQEREE